MTCCFSGHRFIKKAFLERLSNDLYKSIEELIEKGVTRFAAGGALGFDTLAAKTVLKAKEKYPHIELLLILPCKNQAERWREKDKAIYENIKEQSDTIIYTTEFYVDGCMQARNRALVDMSSFLICFKERDSGGAAYTVNYAVNEGLKIINLAENPLQQEIDV